MKSYFNLQENLILVSSTYEAMIEIKSTKISAASKLNFKLCKLIQILKIFLLCTTIRQPFQWFFLDNCFGG